LHLDRNSAKHLEVCLRLRRCGAVKVDPIEAWCRTETCWSALERHLEGSRYIFGWPGAAKITDHDEPQKQPVWVLHIWRNPYHLPRQETLRSTGMEGHLGREWLIGCSTMEEYCERLKVRGAVYYSDVRKCPQARALGLVDRAARLEDVFAELNLAQLPGGQPGFTRRGGNYTY